MAVTLIKFLWPMYVTWLLWNIMMKRKISFLSKVIKRHFLLSLSSMKCRCTYLSSHKSNLFSQNIPSLSCHFLPISPDLATLCLARRSKRYKEENKFRVLRKVTSIYHNFSNNTRNKRCRVIPNNTIHVLEKCYNL